MRMRFLLLVGLSALLLFATVAGASASTPAWRVVALADTTVAPGGSTGVLIELNDEGTAPLQAANGELRLTVTLPSGLKATSLNLESNGVASGGWTCFETIFPTGTVKCKKTSGEIPARVDLVAFRMAVAAGPTLSPGSTKTIVVAAEGGGAPGKSTVAPIRVSGEPPGFGVAALDGQIAGPGAAPFTPAARRPDVVSVSFELNTIANSASAIGDLWPPEAVRNIFVDQPPGLAGNPSAIPQCTLADLANAVDTDARPLCSSDSQVGTASIRFNGTGLLGYEYGPLPVFNLTPPTDAPAQFGFNVLGSVVLLDARVRTGSDYGITIAVPNTPEAIPLVGSTVSLWGDPTSPSHDTERACPGKVRFSNGGPTCQATAPPITFLRQTTSCAPSSGAGPNGGLLTSIHVDSWQHSGRLLPDGSPDLGDPAWQSSGFLSHAFPGFPLPSGPSTFPGAYTGPTRWGEELGVAGCGEVPFEPTISLQPTTNRADSPSGLDFDLTMPQSCWKAGEIEATCQADVKDSHVSQPLGMRINPATADGLTGCSEEQIGLKSSLPPTCPDSSKIGTVEIESPLVPDTLTGGIYQAKQGENPFGSTLAFYAVASADGVMIKLPAEVVSDPQTGQVTTIFRDSPQLPFDHYKLHFFGGSRAPLITPPTCGTYTTHASFTGWANPESPVHPEDSFQIDEGPNGGPCANSEGERPFSPSFEAGTENPLAGAFSPFVLKVGREDGMQELSGLETTLPEGLLGKLAGIPYCPEAAIAAAQAARALAEQASPSCPAASQVGVTDAAAGAGATPFHNPGKAYLAGPYKGAPLSLVIVTPAAAGPLDLGTVVVRAALHLDPETAQIHVVSDPIPSTILEGGDGFPLDVRRIVVQMNRPEFTLNPTSCDPMAVNGTITALQGATANVSNRFQVGGCDRLPFKPKLMLKLKGKTTRRAHPALSAVVLAGASNEANVTWAQVTLPHAEFLDQSHIRNVCTQVQFKGAGCPPSSILGYAKAITPLLDQPLQGPVYLMSGFGHKLPDLAADLNGQIRVLLHGKIDTGPGGGIRTTFEVVPDAFVSKFTLSLKGGNRGLIQNSEDVCAHPQRAVALFDAHNGKIHDTNPKIATGCAGKAHRGKRH